MWDDFSHTDNKIQTEEVSTITTEILHNSLDPIIIDIPKTLFRAEKAPVETVPG